MRILRKIFVVVLVLTAILLAGSRFWHRINDKNVQSFEGSVSGNNIDYTGHILQSSLLRINSFQISGKPTAAITSHHLPTAENFIHSIYAGLKSQNPDIQTFIIVGPDHFEQCGSLITMTKKNFLTPGGELENNLSLGEYLLLRGVSQDDGCFKNEHSIGVQTTFIKTYFPNASVSAILFSSAASQAEATRLGADLAGKYPSAVVICSTDFSHYQTVQKANVIDEKTEKQLRGGQAGLFELEQVDSPASLAFTVAFAKALNSKLGYLAHANSYDFVGIPDNTTGYFNAVYTTQ